MHWVRWEKVMASKQEGGLGVGSLLSFNLDLLFKWRWRFLRCPDALWVRVVKAMYGSDRGAEELITRLCLMVLEMGFYE